MRSQPLQALVFVWESSILMVDHIFLILGMPLPLKKLGGGVGDTHFVRKNSETPTKWYKIDEILTTCIVQCLCSKPVFLGYPQQDPYKMHVSIS